MMVEKMKMKRIVYQGQKIDSSQQMEHFKRRDLILSTNNEVNRSAKNVMSDVDELIRSQI